MTQFDKELYYWTHMLDEAFTDIPQQQKIDMSKQFNELLRQNSINLNKDVANVIKTWFIADSEKMNIDQLKEKYTQDFIQEVRDRLLNYFELKNQSEKSEVDMNGQPFILKGDQSIRMSEDRSTEYLDNVNDFLRQSVGSQTYDYNPSYDLNENDKKEIKLLSCTEHIACWRTTYYKTTNKFIYHIWRNNDMIHHYGDYMYNSPFCTKESGHWAYYSHGNPDYEQFWFFKLPEGCQATSGDLNNPDVMSILDKMAGHGGELLVGLDDTYLDDDNIEDHGTRNKKIDKTSNEFLLSFSFHDYQKIDYSEEIKQFYGKVLFPFKKFEFPYILQCIASYKCKDDEVSDEMRQMCQKIKDKTIESVVIPDGVTSIGCYAFEGCHQLTSVIMSNSVMRIDDEAFSNCEKLKTIKMSNAIKSIGKEAFWNCKSLESIVIPDKVTEIKPATFRDCISLKTIKMPNSIKLIDREAFSGCESLESPIIINNSTTIGFCTFLNCKSLKSISISNAITEIHGNAFSGCESLKSITIPNSVTKMLWNVFKRCTSLTSIVIPNSVVELGQNLFGYCYSLKTVVIPKSVERIGVNMFNQCTSLESIIVPDQKTADVILRNNPEVKNLIKIQPMNERKYSRQQLLEAIDYWTKILNTRHK